MPEAADLLTGPCLCGHPLDDHDPDEGVCRCGCPAWHPVTKPETWRKRFPGALVRTPHLTAGILPRRRRR